MKRLIVIFLISMSFFAKDVFAFEDISNHWAKNYIEYLGNRNMVNGYLDGSFRPENNITREEVVSIFSKYIDENGYDFEDESTESTNKTSFNDVFEDRWSFNSINRLEKLGLIKGYENGQFRPEANITRAEFTKIAYEVFLKANKIEDKKKEFSDTKEHWGNKEISYLAGNGILSGYSDGDFRPDMYINRAEVAKIVSVAENPEISIYNPLDDDKGIGTNAFSIKQGRATNALIKAIIVRGDQSEIDINNTIAYMISRDSGHKINLNISKTDKDKNFNLSFNEKEALPGETYLIYAQVNNSSEQIYCDNIYENLLLGTAYSYDKRLYYKRDKIYEDKLSLKNLLKTATEPLGKTLYIWGGGWNQEDNGAGIDALTVGISPRWEEFFNLYGSGYDYNKTRFQIRDGLDCSGYIGWLIYNTINTENNKSGFVMLADKMAYNFANRGWGDFTNRRNINEYKPGDIMSSATHVYMVLGVADDGSLVIIHSSPPGVKISGTPTPSGKSYSEAVKLAEEYMSKYRPEFHNKFLNTKVPISYLKNFDRMSWDVSGNGLITDPEGIKNMNAREVLELIFNSDK